MPLNYLAYQISNSALLNFGKLLIEKAGCDFLFRAYSNLVSTWVTICNKNIIVRNNFS